jgi:hypothetical protein
MESKLKLNQLVKEKIHIGSFPAAAAGHYASVASNAAFQEG